MIASKECYQEGSGQWKTHVFPIFSILGSEGNRKVDISGYQGTPRHPTICPMSSLIIITLGVLNWESKEDNGVVPSFSKTQV